ncbi:GNAT family N-acetyltransferase [Deinococcus rubellus]|uniref:GNAT family N-acetyltransferase n=1 Tax=Deinococcus rubellus TaxID=1889240 RepID=A0ABY5YDU9_9DEIO|nr:GNAT family N-acetyltransferase [Deinococcus rubellus]UWX63198.1 GNAT family N-acetyltransferase [Deinococcus rubellus]
MGLPKGYTFCVARHEDAALLARFRAAMFSDMGAPLEDGWKACWTAYFGAAVMDRRYWSVLAEVEGVPVSCAGLMFFPMVPVPSDPGGLRAHVQGVYTVPEQRGRGLGEALTREVLAEAQRRGVKSANLNAAVMGRPMYKRMGFEEAKAPEMRLNLGAWTE